MDFADKQAILQQFTEKFRDELNVMLQSADEARNYAIADDAKAENKYDTRGLEASYLAHGQAKRAQDLAKVVGVLELLEVKDFKDKSIEATALVHIEIDGERKAWYFTLPQRGGESIEYKSQKIMSLSPESPLGQNVFGARLGDYFELNGKNGPLEYEIIQVI